LGAPQIVIDVNVLISALMKDGRTRQILVNNRELEFCVPSYYRPEFLKYSGEFAKRLNRPEKEIRRTMKQVFELARIKEFKRQEYKEFLHEAKQISPDPKDAPYFALALKLNSPIWTNDKLLKSQSKVRIISTPEFQ